MEGLVRGSNIYLVLYGVHYPNLLKISNTLVMLLRLLVLDREMRYRLRCIFYSKATVFYHQRHHLTALCLRLKGLLEDLDRNHELH